MRGTLKPWFHSLYWEEPKQQPLERVYAFMYVDAMVVKVKSDGRARSNAVYSVLGIDMEGHKGIGPLDR